MIVRERDIQVAFFKWVNIMADFDWRYKNIFAVPNGSFMGPRQANKMKKEGLKSGVPDVVVAVPTTTSPGMFIEFKAPGKYPEKHQKDWLERLRRAGYFCIVVKNIDDAINTLKKYMGER